MCSTPPPPPPRPVPPRPDRPARPSRPAHLPRPPAPPSAGSVDSYNHHDIGEEVEWRPPLLYANPLLPGGDHASAPVLLNEWGSASRGGASPQHIAENYGLHVHDWCEAAMHCCRVIVPPGK